MNKRISLVAGALVVVMLPGAVAAAGPSTAWTRQFGTSSSDAARGMATDAKGNQYIIGNTAGTLPGQTSKGGDDAFVRKLRRNGRVAWTRQFGTSDSDSASGIAVDHAGRIAVAGRTTGTFPGQTNSGDDDAFVRLFHPTGRSIWTRQFGTNDRDGASDIAIDRGGRIAVVGNTRGAFPGQSSQGDDDVFLRVLRPNGRILWTRQFGTSDRDGASDIAIDRGGRIAVVGNTRGTFPGQSSQGDDDVFVRVLRRNGSMVWTRQFGNGDLNTAGGIAIDRAGRIAVTGTTFGSLPGQTSKGDYDAFVRVLRRNGSIAWTRQFGTSGEDNATSIATDPSGRFAVTGFTLGTFPGQTKQALDDVFVRVLRPNGGVLWTHQFGTSDVDLAFGIAIDRAGRIAVAGATNGAFPGQTNQGDRDAFVRTYRR